MIKQFRFAGDDVKNDILTKYPKTGDLAQIYSENQGATVHKWHHYIPIYERYFSRFRDKPVRFLEIGVSKGGSLQIWRNYFGKSATIYGIDVNPNCAKLNGQAGQVRIGSQDDPTFLQSVVQEMGGVDVILDDGSHHMDHVGKTLDILFPLMSEGGVYMIEDLHTAYWERWGGGYNVEQNFFNKVTAMVSDLHRWYHKEPVKLPHMTGFVSGIHIHDSITVIDKDNTYRPTHSQVGK